ncbi:MAG: TlpA family protein disulfide reductase [Saprospiraceae bacterium]|nr:TlpA family protein disulfide reductase [Saprospiraceae bacterium]
MNRFLLVALLAMVFSTAFGQNKTMPSANVKTLEGQTYNVQELAKSGKITVISFWAIWCGPCRKELDAFLDYHEEWKEKYGVEIVAVSIDDARTVANVRGVIEKHGWPYRVLLDSQRELMQAMNVSNPPYTMLLDKNGQVVFEHLSYKPGDELELEEKIKELAK